MIEFAFRIGGIGAVPSAMLMFFIPGIICGCLCKKLAAKKGYIGYFWTGFFLMLLGLIYVGFLPMEFEAADGHGLEDEDTTPPPDGPR